MTDKVQKIRKEIEKRYEYWKEKEFNSHSVESEIRMSECQHLLLMIDFLQNKPCNHCQGHNNKEECDALVFEHNCPIVKKPISEDLKDTAIQYGNDNFPSLCNGCGHVPVDAFKAGAKWQERQMMSKAIDAQCFGFQGAALFSFRLPADNYLVGSEIKVIVIKED